MQSQSVVMHASLRRSSLNLCTSCSYHHAVKERLSLIAATKQQSYSIFSSTPCIPSHHSFRSSLPSFSTHFSPISQHRTFWSSGSGPQPHIGFAIVPEQKALVIERFGRFCRVLAPGLHFLIPIVDRIAYKHTLKEQTIPVRDQTAITKDNVPIHVDGVLYVRVRDAQAASYGVQDYIYAITQLAQTTMRSELGKLTLDNILSERSALNECIVKQINQASSAWGVSCLRYEIRDILPPINIRNAMEKQSEAERHKRAEILQSEGEKFSDINIASGRQQAVVLKAQGEAEAMREKAKGTAEAILTVASAINSEGGKNAVTLQLAEQYVNAFGNMTKSSNTIILPASVGDVPDMVARAMAVFGGVSKTVDSGMPSPQEHSQLTSAGTNTTTTSTFLPSSQTGGTASSRSLR
eukprot:GHVS01012647.1.p1 GENE.GHVS01012647.1~~GHVS01012647.1.p1  ORF type:complete len:409 (+),score=47.98 GHVS01012647.1:218-1444(+)